MSILTLKRKRPSLKRLKFIVGILFEYGGDVLIDRLRVKYFVPTRCRIHCWLQHRSKGKCKKHKNIHSKTLTPEDWRLILETLGPTFIKFGQILSLRADIVGEEMASELSKLQSSVSSFPYLQVREIIKRELGDYPEKIFSSFERKPIAAASLAQVHKAKTKKGSIVAVKVQRPKVREIIQQDVQILFYLASLIEAHIPESRIYNPTDVVREFLDWTERELDFRTEGHSADRFSAMFKEDEFVNIPKVHWDYTTAHVLTTDFVDGIHADDLSGMKRRNINPKEVAIHGIRALLRQFFIEGFFHADPHPGNFFALKNNVLCLHDFGIVGQLTKKQRQELLSCFIAFVDKDIDAYQKHFLHLAKTNEKSNVEDYKKDIAFLLNEFFYSPKQPSIAWAFFRLINAGSKQSIRFPVDLVLFAKALITTEAMGLTLYPKFRFDEHFKPFVEEAYREYFSPKRIARTLKSDLLDYTDTLRTLPEKLNEVVKKIESGEVGVRINAEDLYGLKEEFDRQNDVRILGVVLTAVLIVTGILFYVEGVQSVFGVSLSSLGLTVTIFLLFWFIKKARETPKNERSK